MSQTALEGQTIVKLYGKLSSYMNDLSFVVRTETFQPIPNAPQIISETTYTEKCAVFPVQVDLEGDLTQRAGTRIILLHLGVMPWEPKLGTFQIRDGSEHFEPLSVTRLAKTPQGEAWDITVEGSVCP